MQDVLLPLANCLRSANIDVKRLAVSTLSLLSSLPLYLSGVNGRRWRRSAAAVMGHCRKLCESMAECVNADSNPSFGTILQHVRLYSQVMIMNFII